MSEKPLSYNKQFQKERPAIRTIAARFMNEALCVQLEAFLLCLEESKMPLSIARCNTYQSNFKGKIVFRIEIANGQGCSKDTYCVKVYTADDPCHFREDNRYDIQNKLEEYLSNLSYDMLDYSVKHLPRCRGCGKCKPGVKLDVLGNSFPGICACDMYAVRFNNPNESDYEMIKKLIAARRQYIIESKSAIK